MFSENKKNFGKVEPFTLKLDLIKYDFDRYENEIIRKLSDVSTIFSDKKEVKKILQNSDPIIYTVGEIKVSNKKDHLIFGIGKIFPGRIGNEFYMTKGHFHKDADGCEIYICLNGCGYLLLVSKMLQKYNFYMEEGTTAYVPPGWAHRTVNTGKEVFTCFYAMPANAGHDYKTIKNYCFDNVPFK